MRSNLRTVRTHYRKEEVVIFDALDPSPDSLAGVKFPLPQEDEVVLGPAAMLHDITPSST